MPRNKPELDREQKRADLVTAARRLLLQDGYAATTVGRIAREAGVAPNTLYWYFDDKDAILVAVVDELLAEGLRDFERRRKSTLQTQLMWLLGRLADLDPLIAIVHARAEVSESVRAWHDGFHAMGEAMIAGELRARGLADGHEAEAARTTMYVVEGLLAHDVSPAEQRKLVKWLVSLA
jgi:AcrR family transcriptional regulator